MDSSSSNDDDEPKICTVFSSNTSEAKTVFDTIAYTQPKKEVAAAPMTQTSPVLLSSIPKFQLPTPTMGMSKTSSMISVLADDLQGGDTNLNTAAEFVDTTNNAQLKEETLKENFDDLLNRTASKFVESKSEPIHTNENLTRSIELNETNDDSCIPTAKDLFSDAPEVAFPVNIGLTESVEVGVALNQSMNAPFNQSVDPQSIFSSLSQNFPVQSTYTSSVSATTNYDNYEASYDAWIPSEETKATLSSISQSPDTFVPDKSNLTMPGIIYEEEFMDKVAINMARVFGESEANRRKILAADNVTQDDNGLRELIKLGCYRSALNLTKRILTLYGQGPHKAGHYSKHSPHSLQVWFTRISLLVRIREFSIAESEVSQFADFEKPDMYYEYYHVSSRSGTKRRGSIVPFHFRLLTAEIPQYLRKFNDTLEKLTKLLLTATTIVNNLQSGLQEDGRLGESDNTKLSEAVQKSLEIWKARQIRILYSLANSSIFSKQYHNAFVFLTRLCDVDKEHEVQLKSAIGRLFLSHGDLTSAQEYFQEAAELRSVESDLDQVDTLVDSALVLITQNSYPEALALLKHASEVQPDNVMILNNMAVCLLYLGKVKESLALMEATMKQNIPQSLQENVLLNLSSIYELENADGSKKNALLKLISEYKGDGVNLASLKLHNLI